MDLNILYDEYRDYSTLMLDSSVISQQQAESKRANSNSTTTAASSRTSTSTSTSSKADMYYRMLMIVISSSVDDSGWIEPTVLDKAETEMLLMCAVLERISSLGLWPTPSTTSSFNASMELEQLSESIKWNQQESCERKLFHLGLNNVRLVNVELQRFK